MFVDYMFLKDLILNCRMNDYDSTQELDIKMLWYLRIGNNHSDCNTHIIGDWGALRNLVPGATLEV